MTHSLVTCTVPEQLSALTRSHQKTIYTILFRPSSEALQTLAVDPRFVGGRIGMIGVLHTWTRDLLSHPHIHSIVPGGALSAEGTWIPSRPDFLVHVKPLAVLFRAKFSGQLHKTALDSLVDKHVWHTDWVVHCAPVGRGEHAFSSLARYLFRVAISNHRILTLEDGHVTFQYKESATDQLKTCTLTAQEFMRRFLQPVLPDRFVKVRSYGLLSPRNRHLLTKARVGLAATVTHTTTPRTPVVKPRSDAPLCPHCGSILILVQTLRPKTRVPP